MGNERQQNRKKMKMKTKRIYLYYILLQSFFDFVLSFSVWKIYQDLSRFHGCKCRLWHMIYPDMNCLDTFCTATNIKLKCNKSAFLGIAAFFSLFQLTIYFLTAAKKKALTFDEAFCFCFKACQF